MGSLAVTSLPIATSVPDAFLARRSRDIAKTGTEAGRDYAYARSPASRGRSSVRLKGVGLQPFVDFADRASRPHRGK